MTRANTKSPKNALAVDDIPTPSWLTYVLFSFYSPGMAATRRRYPPPWRVEERRESYIVTDAMGKPLAYVYFDDESQRQTVTGRIGKDDAWQLARAITRIPGLLRRD
jgi:hypothetical protein